MLAENGIDAPSGSLGADVHTAKASLFELLGFIAEQLPRWRDDPARPREDAETTLTSQLCAFLNSAARHSPGWDILQFRPEERDVQKKSRKIDLVAAPCNATICVDGKYYSHYDTMLPIECKRLPTPKESGRDEREYVADRAGSRGGIQRFKAGDHGGAHSIGLLIAYVQAETSVVWLERIRGWIFDLTEAVGSSWKAADQIELHSNTGESGLMVLRSAHERPTGSRIELRHYWLEMSSPVKCT